ncbi:MAG: 50S ribosomal protein L29 [Cytophagales bacterium]|nr:50S ribosomal protein L29 [Cytophagales bacterium]
MNKKDINILKTEEIVEKLAVEKDMLYRLKFAHSITPIENPMKIRQTKKYISQLHTELTKRTKANGAA